MNKKLPFEESLGQQLSRVPVPDEEASWQKMEALLDQKKRRMPFLWANLDKSLLALLLLLGFLVVVHSTRDLRTGQARYSPVSKQPVGGTKQNARRLQGPQAAGHAQSPAGSKVEPSTAKELSNPDQGISIPSLTLTQPVGGQAGQTGSTKKFGPETGKTANAPLPVIKQEPVKARSSNKNPFRNLQNPLRNPLDFSMVKTGMARSSGGSLLQPASLPDIAVTGRLVPFISAAPPEPATSKSLANLLVKVNSTDLEKKDAGTLARPGHRSFFLLAGIGIQQAIPVGGQKGMAVYRNGNKNPLGDYIPSFFLRGERAGKWYVQAEFSLSAPKPVKGFAYSRQTTADTALRIVTTSQALKKVYYRELPVSFNYYLHSSWSVGAGASYGWFQGAITEKQIATRSLLNQPGSIDKQIVPIQHYTDSFLYRSHTYLLLQTNYQWQSLSVGLRFSQDLQPYIKYTLPDGTVADKKNWSLELLVRLGLWRSSKF